MDLYLVCIYIIMCLIIFKCSLWNWMIDEVSEIDDLPWVTSKSCCRETPVACYSLQIYVIGGQHHNDAEPHERVFVTSTHPLQQMNTLSWVVRWWGRAPWCDRRCRAGAEMESRASPFCSLRPGLSDWNKVSQQFSLIWPASVWIHYSWDTESVCQMGQLMRMWGHLTLISPLSVRTSGSACSRCQWAHLLPDLNTANRVGKKHFRNRTKKTSFDLQQLYISSDSSN